VTTKDLLERDSVGRYPNLWTIATCRVDNMNPNEFAIEATLPMFLL